MLASAQAPTPRHPGANSCFLDKVTQVTPGCHRPSLREQELQPGEGHNGRSRKGPRGQAERQAVGCPRDPAAPRGSCRLRGLCCWSLWFCPSLLSRLPAVSATSPPAPREGLRSHEHGGRAHLRDGALAMAGPQKCPLEAQILTAQRQRTRGRESQPRAGCCCHLQAVLRTSSGEGARSPGGGCGQNVTGELSCVEQLSTVWLGSLGHLEMSRHRSRGDGGGSREGVFQALCPPVLQ